MSGPSLPQQHSSALHPNRLPSVRLQSLFQLSDVDTTSAPVGVFGGAASATDDVLCGSTRGYDHAETPFREPRIINKKLTLAAIEYKIDDPWGALMIQERVATVVERWASLHAVDPEEFFRKMLSVRGYIPDPISAPATRRAPSMKQIEDYTPELVNAVRTGDLTNIHKHWLAGKQMNACNCYSESLLHIACRRADFEVVQYLVLHGGDPNIIDDFGRTPMHDACWRTSQRFDIVTLLMDCNRDLLRQADIRGSTPMSYVGKGHWLEWCAFLFHQKDKWWSVQSEGMHQRLPEEQELEAVTRSARGASAETTTTMESSSTTATDT